LANEETGFRQGRLNRPLGGACRGGSLRKGFGHREALVEASTAAAIDAVETG
jgi:hypothetical protein